MTEFIAHRVNDPEELKRIPKEYGVEIDLRDQGNDIILAHDPFVGGPKFEDWLPHYEHGTLILNIKSERIEFRVLELLAKFKVENFFFLDSSFPMIYLLAQSGEKRSALRLSEFESMDTIRKSHHLASWVWVDCFSRLSITKSLFNELNELGFKVALVSPELQGRPDEITEYSRRLNLEKIKLEAICTKAANVEKWIKAI